MSARNGFPIKNTAEKYPSYQNRDPDEGPELQGLVRVWIASTLNTGNGMIVIDLIKACGHACGFQN